MGLQDIVSEIKKLKIYAEENVDAGPIETLSGRRGRKNQAIEQLIQLNRKYKDEMRNGAIFIVVAGAQRDALAALATEHFECFATDPEEFYNDLAGRVSPVLYLGKETLANTFDVLGRHLEDKMLDLLGLSGEYPQIIFKQQYRRTIKNKEEFTGLVKQAVNEQVGAEIVGIQAVHSLVKTAIEKDHTKKFTPIVLATDDETFIASLMHDLKRRLTKRVFLVVAGRSTKGIKGVEGAIVLKEATQESVADVMKKIKDMVKDS